jgi:flagellar protein FliO/FliZ
MQTPLTFFLAFVIVLALIGLAAWLVRRFAGNRLGTSANRGRMPRLAVIDAAAVDGRRRLVLVRRDNVEHLIMIGGPSDIVIESTIIRAIPGREAAPQRGGIGSDLGGRTPAADGPSWAEMPEAPEPEPASPESLPRPMRPAFVDDHRRPAAPLPERRPEPIASVAPEAPSRPETRPEPAAPRTMARNEMPRSEMPRSEMPRSEMPRSEPMMPRPLRADPPIRSMPPPRTERASVVTPTVSAPAIAPVVSAPTPPAPPPPAPVAPAASADQSLADMAQRLEAALRRPVGEPRAEIQDMRSGGAGDTRIPPRSPDLSIASPAREAPTVAPPVKTGFENLEDEMASLLGRPKSSS